MKWVNHSKLEFHFDTSLNILYIRYYWKIIIIKKSKQSKTKKAKAEQKPKK